MPINEGNLRGSADLPEKNNRQNQGDPPRSNLPMADNLAGDVFSAAMDRLGALESNRLFLFVFVFIYFIYFPSVGLIFKHC